VLITSTIAKRLILIGTMACLCLWLTASRGGLAQDAKPERKSSPGIDDPPGQAKPRVTVTSSPATPSDAAAPSEPSPIGPLELSTPGPRSTSAPPFAPDATSKRSSESVPVDLTPTAPAAPESITSDDPEKNAQAFVEQNRKQAETELKTLKDEAERLRARLRKVDSGIKRWEALLQALRQSESTAGGEPQRRPVVSNAATALDPVPPDIGRTPGTLKDQPDPPVEQELQPAPKLNRRRASPPIGDSKKR
jgi:hypothetical protein